MPNSNTAQAVVDALFSPTQRSIGWQQERSAALLPFLRHSYVAYPFRNLPLTKAAPELRASFARYADAPQHEYAYHYRQPAQIEPRLGYLLHGPRTIVAPSMPHYWEVGFPPFLATQLARTFPRQVVRLPRVISLREFGDTNYYHFFNDVLGKLALLEELGIDTDMPLVVSAALAQKPFFQTLLRQTGLGRRHWLVQQPDMWIDAQETLFCKPLPHAKRNFDWVLRELAAIRLTPKGEQRIFLTRKPERGRWILNGHEVEAVCAEWGFKTIDTEEMSLEQQIACFAGARFVIGIHGAGLVNCVFRSGAPLDLLELFPPDNLPPHYFWLCQNFDFGYHALVGDASSAPRAFRVDIATLRSTLHTWLGNP